MEVDNDSMLKAIEMTRNSPQFTKPKRVVHYGQQTRFSSRTLLLLPSATTLLKAAQSKPSLRK
jgi:hypothetical protein